MKRIIYIVVVLVLITTVFFRLKSNKQTTQERVYQYNKEEAIYVYVDTLQYELLENNNFYTGTFEPNKKTKISTDIQGKIKTVLVDAGSVVKKDQALIRLDNSLLKLQLQSIEIQTEGLKTDVKRYTVLANAGAIQGIQLEKSVLGLKSANVQKAILIEQIDKTTIVAPFDGIVSAKLTEEGAFAAPSIPLLQIIDIQVLKFTINVPENDLKLFKLNQIYSLSVDVYPETLLSGKVSLIGSEANMSKSFPIQFTLSNTSDLLIKSGMFGKVKLKNVSEEKHIIIPASTIVGTFNQAQVYVLKNKKAILQNITISSRVQNKAIISSGLKEGDIIVTNGFVNLFDGANVSVK